MTSDDHKQNQMITLNIAAILHVLSLLEQINTPFDMQILIFQMLLSLYLTQPMAHFHSLMSVGSSTLLLFSLIWFTEILIILIIQGKYHTGPLL